jgi:putative phage-type endonuclease
MMEQRTDEWFAARCGKVTASALHKVMARTKSGYGADRANYLTQLVIERLTGKPLEGFTNAAMQWGIDTEAQARATYAMEAGEVPVEVGFLDHPTIAMTGASPDGLVGRDGMLEIKCPTSATHWAVLDGAGIERKYLLQMQWQMACAGRQWCDFVSFDPRFPLALQLHVERVSRDDGLIADLEGEVATFLEEVAAAVARGEQRMKEAA